MDDNDHDRLIRLEERVAQWMTSLRQEITAEAAHIRRELEQHRQRIAWVIGLLGTIAAAVVIALLTRGV